MDYKELIAQHLNPLHHPKVPGTGILLEAHLLLFPILATLSEYFHQVFTASPLLGTSRRCRALPLPVRFASPTPLPTPLPVFSGTPALPIIWWRFMPTPTHRHSPPTALASSIASLAPIYQPRRRTLTLMASWQSLRLSRRPLPQRPINHVLIRNNPISQPATALRDGFILAHFGTEPYRLK